MREIYIDVSKTSFVANNDVPSPALALKEMFRQHGLREVNILRRLWQRLVRTFLMRPNRDVPSTMSTVRDVAPLTLG